ncbi:MAG: DUF2007 domain-containing protein [Bacteroidales bacterium]|jgi:hypothetical protein|nr:DUF2007 domain-containing protein [Bacteroidales bacterium]MBR6091990.1 DUF2007 domain-containing protein [Bacteroidales bacterium]
MEKGLEKIFIGTDIEANYIAAMLKEENIPCFAQNNFQASINAGWADGSFDQSTVLLVYTDDLEKAKAVVDSYLNNE